MKLDFGLGGESLVADNRDHLKALLRAQVQAWMGLEDKRGNRKHGPGAEDAMSRLRAAIQAVESEKLDSVVVQEVLSILNRLCAADSPVRRIIESLDSTGLPAGLAAQLLFGNFRGGPNSIKELGLTDRNGNSMESSMYALGIAGALFVVSNRELGSIDAHATTSSWIESRRRRLESLIADAERAKSALDDATDRYETQAALRAATKYWSGRRWLHFAFSVLWMIATIGAAVSACVLLFMYAESYVAKPILNGEQQMAVLASRVVVFATLSAIVIWFIRFSSRNYMSHSHMSNDAAERSVMTQSYFALSKDADFASGEHLDIVLRALFRPGTSGLVKEDIGPTPPTLDALIKLTRGTGKSG